MSTPPDSDGRSPPTQSLVSRATRLVVEVTALLAAIAALLVGIAKFAEPKDAPSPETKPPPDAGVSTPIGAGREASHDQSKPRLRFRVIAGSKCNQILLAMTALFQQSDGSTKGIRGGMLRVGEAEREATATWVPPDDLMRSKSDVLRVGLVAVGNADGSSCELKRITVEFLSSALVEALADDTDRTLVDINDARNTWNYVL